MEIYKDEEEEKAVTSEQKKKSDMKAEDDRLKGLQFRESATKTLKDKPSLSPAASSRVRGKWRT